MTTYINLSDLELTALLKEDDELAFNELYSRLRPAIYQYAFRICKSQDDADEIVQNVMFKVWTHRKQIDSERNVKGWILKITTNQAFDFLKALAKEQVLKEKVWQQMQQLPAFTEDQYVLKEYLLLVEKAIKALPLQQQKVFRLSREEDLTYEEIGKRLGISTNTVRNHMTAALSSIRNYLKQNNTAALPPIVALCLIYGGI